MQTYSLTSSRTAKGWQANAGFGFDIRYLVGPIIALAFTLWLDPYYTGGDPFLYRFTYEALGSEGLGDGFKTYSYTLDSTEPVYYFVVWVCSHIGISREIFIGLSSAILAFLSTTLLVRRGASLIVTTIIVSSSFYFLLLYSTTERLKLAVIFMIASMLLSHRPKTAIFLALLAVGSHIQVALIYAALVSIYMTAQLRDLKARKALSPRVLGTAALAVIAIGVGYFAIADQIGAKLTAYAGVGQQEDLLRMIPLYALTLLYTRERLYVTLLFLPLVVLVPIIGYGRLNIFAYFIFLYYAAARRKGFNIGIILTTVYFTYSSFAFVDRIMVFGNPNLVDL